MRPNAQAGAKKRGEAPKTLEAGSGNDMIKEIQKRYECNRRKGPPGEKEFTFDGEKLRRYKVSTELADAGSGDS